jgi:hypothetical protein
MYRTGDPPVLRLVRATHPDATEAPEIVQKREARASVRAAQAMILAARPGAQTPITPRRRSDPWRSRR